MQINVVVCDYCASSNKVLVTILLVHTLCFRPVSIFKLSHILISKPFRPLMRYSFSVQFSAQNDVI
jgi:hypothetical protein